MGFIPGTVIWPTDKYDQKHYHIGQTVIKMVVGAPQKGPRFHCTRYYKNGVIDEGYIEYGGFWWEEVYLNQGLWTLQLPSTKEVDYDEMV